MKKRNSKIYLVSTGFILIAILISIIIPLKTMKKEINQVEITKENNGLPKIESFENFFNTISSMKKEDSDMAKTETEEQVVYDTALSNLDYSKTNIQVQGVEEADIVKTDGEYIYYISNKKVIIVSTNNKLKIISEIDFEDEKFLPKDIYVNENKLVVIGCINLNDNNEFIVTDTIYPEEDNVNCKIYNIERKSKPKLERELQIEGSYLASRMIDSNLYLISNKYINSYLFNNIDELNENDYKPKYLDTKISQEEQVIEYGNISYFPESEDASYLTILGVNINSDEKANIEAFLGGGETIYCSENYLYIAKTKYEVKDEKVYGYYNNVDINTYIYKFEIKDSKIEYENAGTVPGSILNQFSMDEYEECFRIATTNNKNFNSETSVNNLYILNNNLEITGALENLAKGEKIYAVRFIGNRAYIVTFVETDPLFVLDLSDSTNPAALGELKIPGYSKYLHPYDETHIIGFGENTETNENGNTIATGMKMALFNVEDPSNPTELFSTNIGEKGTTSEILYNHKSLLFLKEKGIIAFPIFISEELENYKLNLKFQGAIVYNIDLENGFIEKGKIAHQEIEEETFNYEHDKIVERILFINDNLYTLSQNLIKCTNLETMEKQQELEIKK